jgi:hypothetical protein
VFYFQHLMFACIIRLYTTTYTDRIFSAVLDVQLITCLQWRVDNQIDSILSVILQT